MPFCPRCGKNIQADQSFCEEHKPRVFDIKEFELQVCACGRMHSKNQWFYPNNLQESVHKIIKDHVKQKVIVEIVELNVPEKRRNKGWGKAIARQGGESEDITFSVKLTVCDKCQKLGTHYYTAKLQLRKPPAEAVAYVKEYMAGVEEKGMAINKVEDTPRGPDLFLTHKSVARQLGEKLVRKYGGVMKQSEQLFSRNKQTSKDLFRLNVVVEFPRFRVGEVIVVNKRPVLVTGLGKQCTGRDLVEDKKVVLVAGQETEVLKIHTATVSTTHPELTVIDPESYQQVRVENPDKSLEISTQVRVVKSPTKKIYILPPKPQ